MSIDADDDVSTNATRLKLKCGVLSKSDGSCRFQLGSTCVVASIIGPIAEQQSDVSLSSRLSFNFFYSGGDNVTPRLLSMERLLRGVFEQAILLRNFPRTCIKVSVQMLNNGGSLFACALLACSAAFMDAGIPMTMVPSATCSVLSEDSGSWITYPDLEQESSGKAYVDIVFDNDGNVLVCNTSGKLSQLQMKQLVKQSAKEANRSRGFLVETFSEHSEQILKRTIP